VFTAELAAESVFRRKSSKIIGYLIQYIICSSGRRAARFINTVFYRRNFVKNIEKNRKDDIIEADRVENTAIGVFYYSLSPKVSFVFW